LLLSENCVYYGLKGCIIIETKDLRIKVRNIIRFSNRQNYLLHLRRFSNGWLLELENYQLEDATVELTGATEAAPSGEEGWQSACYDTGSKRLRPG